jgi:two-component system OmpR family response regulator
MLSPWNTQWSGKGAKPPGSGAYDDAVAGQTQGAGALLRKVLVVDDEQDLADLAATLLNARGLDVVVAYSGHAAMELLAQDPDIDAVFSDVVMPGMTGLQMADAIREMYPRVKVVLASGYTLPAMLANRERPYLYTTKPYRIDTILGLLRT